MRVTESDIARVGKHDIKECQGNNAMEKCPGQAVGHFAKCRQRIMDGLLEIWNRSWQRQSWQSNSDVHEWEDQSHGIIIWGKTIRKSSAKAKHRKAQSAATGNEGVAE